MAELSQLKWSEKYYVGTRAMDDEHKNLFDAVKEIESSMARNEKPAEIKLLLKKLVAATRSHFACEERAMQEAKYPGLALHSANHQRLMQKVEAFAARYSQSGTVLNEHALSFLRDWLVYHIENDDLRLGTWLSEHSAG